MFAIFQCRSIACEWTCTWSWSWQYDKSLTRVKEFDQTQSKVKLHKKVWAWTSNFGFGRISLIWGDKLSMIFFWKEIPSTLQRRAWFHSSNHTTLVNYLDSMGSLWGNMFTRTWKNARNKEYASLFMEVQGVHRVIGKVYWVYFLVISMNAFKLKNLGSKRSVFAQTIVWRGRRWNWGKSELVWSN